MKVYILFITLLLLSCKPNNPYLTRANEDYKDYKKNFPDSLVNHFPKKIQHFNNGTIYSSNISKNDVNLILYEVNLTNSEFKSISNLAEKEAIAKYNGTRDCLLIVNRFETKESYESREPVELDDIIQIDKECFKGLYPIPNFKVYSYSNFDLSINNLEIYVLESKSNVKFEKFNLKPNPQMPNDWENGFSRGIALNKKNNTVIYWLIIW